MQGARTDNLWYEPNGDVTEPAKDGSLSVLVNTSNCVGAMGAGVAKRFAERYPILLPDFREACRNGAFKPGRPRFHHMTDDISVMHIPTKDDWRNGSRYSWVAGGLLLAGKMAENLAIDRGVKSLFGFLRPDAAMAVLIGRSFPGSFGAPSRKRNRPRHPVRHERRGREKRRPAT